MKVALATRSLTRGGAQVQLVNLAFGLARRGHVVFVVVLYAGGALQAVLEAGGIAVHCLKKRGRWDMFGPWSRYVALTRQLGVDVIYSFLPLENLLSLAVSGVTGVTLVWGLRGASQDVRQHGYASLLLWSLQRRLMHRVGTVISNSRAAIDELSKTPDQQFVVIPNGIDTDRFRPDAELRRAFRGEFGLDQGELLIGCVARLDVVKGHPNFLKAAALIAARRRAVRFLVIGSGPPEYQASLVRLADQLGIGAKVQWLGERNDIEIAMNALDIYMSASSAEGFSNSLCEAMACGVLPVATDVGDSRTIIGRFGAVVPAGSPEQLAEAAIDWLARDTAQLRTERRSWIVENFGVDRMVDESLRVIATAVQRDS